STKKEYFQGVSMIGRDCILERFRLQSFRMFSTEARLPWWSSSSNFREALLMVRGEPFFPRSRIRNLVALFFMLWIPEDRISRPYNSAATVPATAATPVNLLSAILFAASAVSEASINFQSGNSSKK